MDQHQPVLLQQEQHAQRQQTIASADIDLPNNFKRSWKKLFATEAPPYISTDHYGRAAGKQPDADAHRSCFSEVPNAIVIDKFKGKQRMVKFAGDTVIEDDENWGDNTLNLLLIFSSRITY